MGITNIWHVMNLIPNQRPVTPEALAAVYKVFRGNLRGLLLALDEATWVLIGRTKGGGQGRPSRGFRLTGAGRLAFGGLLGNGVP